MKHSVFSKLAVSLLLCATLAGCVKHDELEFKGRVIDVRHCDMSYLDQHPGYVVQLEYPEGVGGTITDGNNTAENIIVLYEPTRHIMVDDVIHGRFYLDEKYSRTNCSQHWEPELPEGVFIKVEVE